MKVRIFTERHIMSFQARMSTMATYVYMFSKITLLCVVACSVTVQTGEVIEGEIAMVTLNVTGTLVAPLNVTLETRNGDAKASSDYVPQTVIVAIQPGQKSVVIEIQTLTDSEREMKETFDVIVTTADCVGGVNQQIGTIPIIDNTTGEVAVLIVVSLYGCFIPYMKTLIHHFPTCYVYCVKKAYRKLNLERVLDKDTEVFSFLSSFLLFLLLLHWARQLFLGIPPFISDPGNLYLFLDLS